MYTIVLATQPTATVTVDIGGASGELTVSPSRLFFTPENYDDAANGQCVRGRGFRFGGRYRDPHAHHTRRGLHGRFGNDLQQFR